MMTVNSLAECFESGQQMLDRGIDTVAIATADDEEVARFDCTFNKCYKIDGP